MKTTFTQLIKTTFLTCVMAFGFILSASADQTWTGNQNFTSNTTISGNVITDGNISVTVASGVTVTITGSLNIKDDFTKLGAGTIIVHSEVNGWDATLQEKGNLYVQAGKLVVGNNNTTAQIRRMHTVQTTGGELVVSRSNTCYFYEGDSDNRDYFFYEIDTDLSFNIGGIGKEGSGGLIWAAGLSPHPGYVRLAGGNFQFFIVTNGLSSGFGISTSAGTAVDFNITTGTYTYSGQISGAAVVKKTGTGTLTLSGNSPNLTQYLQVDGGTVNLTGYIDNAGVFMQGENTVLTMNANHTLKEIWGHATTAAIVLNSNAVLYVNGNTTTPHYEGKIQGNGSLIKNGTHSMKLSGASTFGGGVTVRGGTLEFSAGNNLGAGNITMDGGTLVWASGNTADISNRITSVAASPAKFNIQSNNVTFASALPSGTYSLEKYGEGRLTLTADQTYTGNTSVKAGTLQLGDNTTNGIVAGSIYLEGLSGTNCTLTFKHNTSKTFSQSISGYAEGVINAIENNGTGTLTFTNGFIMLGAVGTNVFRCQGTSTTIFQGGITGIPTDEINIATSAKAIINNTSNITWGGKISGAGTLEKSGAGKLTMSSTDNSCTGALQHTGGTLSIKKWAGTYSQSSGTTLEIPTGTTTFASAVFSGGGTILGTFTNSTTFSKIQVTNGVTATGTTTFVPTVSAAGSYALLQAGSGVSSTTPYAVNNPSYNTTLSVAANTLTMNSTQVDNTAPTAGTLSAGTPTPNSIPLSWTVGSDNLTPTANLTYYVYQSTSNNIATVATCQSNGLLLFDGTNITSFTPEGLNASTTYYFNVVVSDQAGLKAAYNMVSAVTLQAPAVNFVTVTPNSATLAAGGTQQFAASVSATGGANTAVIWSVEGAEGSTYISSGGLLTVGADETGNSITVRATSVFDNSKSGTATVTIQTSGLSELSQSGITVWTAGDELRIENVLNTGSKLFLFDLGGRTVLTENLLNSNTINISGLPQGIYIVRIDNYSGKIVKR